MRTLIRDGRVLDPGYLDGMYDVLVKDGCIEAVLPRAGSMGETGGASESAGEFDRVIDAAGLLVVPGLIDMHVHLREPGQTHKETIRTGSLAAAGGGFTAVLAMPNTTPSTDSVEVVRQVQQTAAEAHCRVYLSAAITTGQKGQTLTDFAALKKQGVLAVTDDGMPVTDAHIMKQALLAAQKSDLAVISHSEEPALAQGGAMNLGTVSRKLGIAGIPNSAESVMVMRDTALSAATQAPVHIAHVSTKESVDIIRTAKKSSVPVTAETAPHYFTLTHEAVEEWGANAKMNPPLRSGEDRLAVQEGLCDGTLDAIATDHAPHAPDEKGKSIMDAPFGIIGLETAFPLSLALVEKKVITLEQLIALFTKGPGGILGITPRIEKGRAADITILDLEKEWEIDASRFFSKSRNTPFDRCMVKGIAVVTMVGGDIRHENMAGNKNHMSRT